VGTVGKKDIIPLWVGACMARRGGSTGIYLFIYLIIYLFIHRVKLRNISSNT